MQIHLFLYSAHLSERKTCWYLAYEELIEKEVAFLGLDFADWGRIGSYHG